MTTLKKTEVQEIRQIRQILTNIAANITEYHRIIIQKFIMIRQLFLVKIVCKNVENQHV